MISVSDSYKRRFSYQVSPIKGLAQYKYLPRSFTRLNQHDKIKKKYLCFVAKIVNVKFCLHYLPSWISSIRNTLQKNIPCSSLHSFNLSLTDKIVDFVKRLRWKAHFYINPSEIPNHKHETCNLTPSPQKNSTFLKTSGSF